MMIILSILLCNQLFLLNFTRVPKFKHNFPSIYEIENNPESIRAGHEIAILFFDNRANCLKVHPQQVSYIKIPCKVIGWKNITCCIAFGGSQPNAEKYEWTLP